MSGTIQDTSVEDLFVKGEKNQHSRTHLKEAEHAFTPLFNYTHLYAHHSDLEGYLFDHEGCVDFSKSTKS